MAFLGELPRNSNNQGPITEVQIMSDCRNDNLLIVVSTVIAAIQEHEPHYTLGENTFLAARGARQLAKRYLWRQEHNRQDSKAEQWPSESTLSRHWSSQWLLGGL